MLLRSRSNGGAIPKMADRAPSGVLGCEINNEPAQAIRLLRRTITFLTAPPVPAVLRAFDQLGVSSGLIADVLDIDRGVVTAWRRGQSEIPEEHRVTLLTYLSVLLPWLYGAERQVTGPASPLALWRQRTQAARQLLDIEMRATPLLARRSQALANCMDLVDRHAAARAIEAREHQPQRIVTRRPARKTGPTSGR